MPENIDAIINALQNMTDFQGLEPADILATRLGGLTNLVYRVETRGQKLIVRIPGAGTEEFINRSVELHNARAAADAGVSARVRWADSKTGVMISDCIDPAKTMTPQRFKSIPESAAAAGKVLAKLHNSGQEFQFRFELFAMIDEYLEILAGKTVTLPKGYHDIVAAAKPVKVALASNPAALAPCHCDPLCENFLLDENAVMWMVDWEYSGMNDPIWDLADLSVEGQFDDAQESAMLHAYFGRAPSQAETARVVIYKAMCDLLWTLWGLIQHANNNPAEDFWAYATTRFERCKTLMESPDFESHIKAIS